MTELERYERRAEVRAEVRRQSAIEADWGGDETTAKQAFAAKKRLAAELEGMAPDPTDRHIAEKEAAFRRRVTEMRIRGGVG